MRSELAESTEHPSREIMGRGLQRKNVRSAGGQRCGVLRCFARGIGVGEQRQINGLWRGLCLKEPCGFTEQLWSEQIGLAYSQLKWVYIAPTPDSCMGLALLA